MKTAFIIHGTGGHSQENWFPWLKAKLEQEGLQVIIPDFGTDAKPDIIRWKEVFKQYEKLIDQDTILIGHSLGGSFLLKFLENFEGKVDTLITVGSPVGVKPIRFYEGDSNFLNGFDFEWEQIREKIKYKIMFHSDNDPYVSLGNGEELARKIGTELIFIPNAGHFNTDSGYVEFSRLLTEIKKYL